MSKNQATAFLIIALIVLAAAIGFFFKATQPAPPTSVSNEEDSAVRTVVTEFGTKLQMVSLLASTSERKAEMDTAYAPYLTPELLTQWYPEGSDALGRHTSSPWPDRIEVVEVRFIGNTATAEGNIIEVATATSSTKTPVGVQPVTFTLEKQNGAWRISRVAKGAYSELPHSQSIVGFWECLPHKDTTGPQTMECAFGIAVDQSDGHYAVDTSLMSTYPVDYSTGTKVRVTGIVTPANQLSSIQKYDIDGIIRATTIEKL